MSLGHLKTHVLRYFVAVYEEGSVNRAAARLNVVPATVSGQLRALEEAYGVELFLRAPEGLLPTPNARRMYNLTKPILASMTKIDQQLSDASREVAGAVRIGVMTSICRSVIGPVVADFRRAHADVSISIVEGLSEDLARLVEQDRLDLAVCNPPASQRDVVYGTILDDPCVIVSDCPSGDLRAVLENRDLVVPSTRHFLRRRIDAFIRDTGCRSYVVEADGLGATISLLRAGGSCSILPEIAVRDLLSQFNFLVIPTAKLISEIAFLHRRDRPLSRPSSALLDKIEHAIKSVPPAVQKN